MISAQSGLLESFVSTSSSLAHNGCPSLTTDASANIAQEFCKYAIIMRNVCTSTIPQVSLNHGKRAD